MASGSARYAHAASIYMGPRAGAEMKHRVRLGIVPGGTLPLATRRRQRTRSRALAEISAVVSASSCPEPHARRICVEIFAPALACLEIYSRKAAADTPDLGTVCDARARQARRSSTITAKEGTLRHTCAHGHGHRRGTRKHARPASRCAHKSHRTQNDNPLDAQTHTHRSYWPPAICPLASHALSRALPISFAPRRAVLEHVAHSGG